MRLLNGLFALSVFSATLLAQNRGINPQPFVRGTFGNVVFPGGTAAMPGVHRAFPNAVFPGGTGPQLVIPFSSNDPTRLMGAFGQPFRGGRNGQRSGRGATFMGVPYAVPVFVGGYGYGYVNDSGYQQPIPQQQPNIIVVYPPAPQPVIGGPVIGGNDSLAAGPPLGPPPEAQASDQPEPSHYLIAFKDHTIFSAVAYWVEGNTLHYFTTPNTHNQVSLSLVDKDLTERLNREAGINMPLPNN